MKALTLLLTSSLIALSAPSRVEAKVEINQDPQIGWWTTQLRQYVDTRVERSDADAGLRQWAAEAIDVEVHYLATDARGEPCHLDLVGILLDVQGQRLGEVKAEINACPSLAVPEDTLRQGLPAWDADITLFLPDRERHFQERILLVSDEDQSLKLWSPALRQP